MDYRKIIKFGVSSHVVSLPNDWMRKNNLKKGDVIYIQENGNNEITLSPKEKTRKKEVKQIAIDANNKNIERLRREISAAYINNFNVISISDNNLEKRSKEIRDLIHGLVALEIMGQTKNTIIARDFLNIKRISINNLVRRTDIILRNMIADSILCVNEDHYESVKERDNDVNRIYLLTNRVIRRALNDPDVSKSLNLPYEDAMSVHWLFINFEAIGDEAKRICRVLKDIKLTKKEKQELIAIQKEIERHYLDMMTAYYNNDEELAHSIMDKKRDIMARVDMFFAQNPNIAKGIIADKLKSMESYIKNIGRIVLKKY